MAFSSIFAAAAPALLGKLFGAGGNSPQLPYANAVSGDLNDVNSAGQSLTGLGSQQTGQFNAFQPQATNAVNQDLNLLQSNPYTDTFSAMQLANATKGNNAAFNAARTGATDSLIQRGLGGDGSVGGGLGSQYAGALTGVDAAQAAAMGGAQNNLAMNAIQQRYSNLGQAANLSTGYANQLYGQGVGATQAGGQLNDQAANGYLNLGNAQQGVNENYQQQQQQFGQGLGSILSGGLAPLLSGAKGAGVSGAGIAAPAVNPFSAPGGIASPPNNPFSMIPGYPVQNAALGNGFGSYASQGGTF